MFYIPPGRSRDGSDLILSSEGELSWSRAGEVVTPPVHFEGQAEPPAGSENVPQKAPQAGLKPLAQLENVHQLQEGWVSES